MLRSSEISLLYWHNMCVSLIYYWIVVLTKIHMVSSVPKLVQKWFWCQSRCRFLQKIYTALAAVAYNIHETEVESKAKFDRYRAHSRTHMDIIENKNHTQKTCSWTWKHEIILIYTRTYTYTYGIAY